MVSLGVRVHACLLSSDETNLLTNWRHSCQLATLPLCIMPSPVRSGLAQRLVGLGLGLILGRVSLPDMKREASMSVCLLVTIVSPANNAQLIEMPLRCGLVWLQAVT